VPPLVKAGLIPPSLRPLGAGIVLSFFLPFIAYAMIRAMTRLDTLNASAVAGHYGSISIVTFVTAVSLVEARGIASEGYLVAVAAVMEVPAIMSALWMVARTRNAPVFDAKMLHHILGNGSVVLLVGSFVMG
jgi:hypothetical protein